MPRKRLSVLGVDLNPSESAATTADGPLRCRAQPVRTRSGVTTSAAAGARSASATMPWSEVASRCERVPATAQCGAKLAKGGAKFVPLAADLSKLGGGYARAPMRA